MYVIRTPGYRKQDQHMRWALPDRVFFACGACHILAYAFLERFARPGMTAQWIRPAAGFTGNHIFVAWDDRAFDYHGISRRDRLLSHYTGRARHHHPGWAATVIDLPADVLISEAKSRRYDGLWLREPAQFHRNALPRARAFLDGLDTRAMPPSLSPLRV